MTVKEMLARMDSEELSYWMAFIALRNQEEADAQEGGGNTTKEPHYFTT